MGRLPLRHKQAIEDPEHQVNSPGNLHAVKVERLWLQSHSSRGASEAMKPVSRKRSKLVIWAAEAKILHEVPDDLASRIRSLFIHRVDPHIDDWNPATQTIRNLAERCYTQGLLDFLELCTTRPLDVIPFIGTRDNPNSQQ